VAKQITVQVFSVGFTDEEIKERSTWHETTWLEIELPEAIEKECSEYVINRIQQFEKSCGCGLCQLHKKHNQ